MPDNHKIQKMCDLLVEFSFVISNYILLGQLYNPLKIIFVTVILSSRHQLPNSLTSDLFVSFHQRHYTYSVFWVINLNVNNLRTACKNIYLNRVNGRLNTLRKPPATKETFFPCLTVCGFLKVFSCLFAPLRSALASKFQRGFSNLEGKVWRTGGVLCI